jgi:signal transduction histidine kinase/ActR/RegA family two-component response regulator
VYIFCIWALAAGLLVFALWSSEVTPWLLLALALLTPALILSQIFEVELPIGDNVVVITVVSAIFTFMAPIVGLPGVLVIVVGTLLVDLWQRRLWYRALFNAAQLSITYIAVEQVYALLTPEASQAYLGLRGLITLAAMTGVYYVVNSLLVSTVVALASDEPVLQVYRQTFGKVSIFDVATMPLGALLAVLWQIDAWAVLIGLVPLLMTQRAFAALAQAQEKSRQSAQLALESQQMAAQLEQLLTDLRLKQDELLHSSKLAALGTFAAGIAHEFNNLLAGLLGFAELGLRSSNPEDKDESLRRTVSACMHGRSITSGLLTFARHREPTRSPHDLRDAVGHALSLVERDLQRAGIRIEKQIAPVPYTVCDLGQIVQVLLNLLSNARDAMLEQGGGTITIALAERGRQIELRVSDTGHGIPEELQRQIFQPFMTTKGPLGGGAAPGTGLGLAISYGIIENHGGSIEVFSQPGEGATFVVRLPVVDLPEDLPLPEPDSPPLTPLRLLVVDDDRTVREAMTGLLDRQGHVVTAASDGEQALDFCGRQPFDVVICDVAMPGIDGVELAERLRMLNPLLGVLLVTGNAPDDALERLHVLGPAQTLHKPFSADDLLRAVERTARSRAVPVGSRL